MSDAPNRDANGIEWKAADWLQRRQFWNWSADDQAQLDAWLAESSTHRVAFLRLKSGYAQTERLVALRSIKPERESRPRARWFQAVAALIAVSAIATGAAFYFQKSEGVTYATPVGGRQTLTLADGTRIELNTDTVLKLNRQRGVRSVTLVRGEAYFQVQHDAARPFVVETAGHTVTDLGTKFTVRAEPGREQAMFELTQHALRTPGLHDLPAEQYARYHAVAAALLEEGADRLGIRWSVSVADLARLVVGITDGVTLAWLADRDDAAAERVLDLAADALAAFSDPTGSNPTGSKETR